MWRKGHQNPRFDLVLGQDLLMKSSEARYRACKAHDKSEQEVLFPQLHIAHSGWSHKDLSWIVRHSLAMQASRFYPLTTRACWRCPVCPSSARGLGTGAAGHGTRIEASVHHQEICQPPDGHSRCGCDITEGTRHHLLCIGPSQPESAKKGRGFWLGAVPYGRIL